MSSTSDLTALLAHTGWIRALARSLAADVHLAEDLVQDAWVAALERPPELGRPVRGWLATVLRHRWLDLERQGRRRQDREQAVARDEAWPSSHDVVEKASIQRRLVDAVLELDEPYRTTVLLRFFEELPQREIARRMQSSSATVNSRLTRALAKLRQRMARGGGRSAWLRVLVPLLKEPSLAPVAFLGAGVMKVVLTCVLVAASVIAGIWLWPSRAAAPQPIDSVAVLQQAAAAERRGGTAADPGVEAPNALATRRTPVATEPRANPAPSPDARIVRGRVLDATGTVLPGVALVLSARDSKATCTSGAGGWFEIALDVQAETIVAADPRYATVLAGSARVHGATQPIVVVAPRIEVAGIVVDEPRAPLADASLELLLPPGFGAEWGLALDYSVPQHWRARSRNDGRFDLAAVPAVAGATIHAALAGFAPRTESAPLSSTAGLEVVLTRPRESAGLVRGVVLDAAGVRTAAARVSAGQEIAVTDAHGEFTLDVRGEGVRLVALKPGSLPAVFAPEKDARGRPRWPADVVLQLGGPPSTLSGRVVGADGKPIAGARVWLVDPTPFGRSAETRLVAESLIRGDERFWSYETTRADGTFAIGGLLPRTYRLQAVDPRTLAGVESAPVASERSPIELRLPTDDVHAKVAGRIVTSSGRSIGGVTVRLFRVTYELQHESGTDNDCVEGEPVVTAADGAFEFRNVPKQGVDVIASGDTILSASACLAQEADPSRIQIVASLRLHLQVELDEPIGRADRLRVLDAGGKRVVLSVFRGAGAHADFEMPIRDGRSVVLSVDERAATLVLLRGDAEVARLPLHLAPGSNNVVRY